MTNSVHTEPVPWYRLPIVWFIIGIPLSSVIVGMIMLTLSIRSFDGLVVDDYYKRGKEINRVLERDIYANQNNISANVRLSSEKLLVAINTQDLYALSPEIEVQFLHPTQSGRDFSLRVDQQNSGHYSAELSQLPVGRWIVQIGTPLWRLVTNVNIQQETGFVMRPLASTGTAQQ